MPHAYRESGRDMIGSDQAYAYSKKKRRKLHKILWREPSVLQQADLFCIDCILLVAY